MKKQNNANAEPNGNCVIAAKTALGILCSACIMIVTKVVIQIVNIYTKLKVVVVTNSTKNR